MTAGSEYDDKVGLETECLILESKYVHTTRFVCKHEAETTEPISTKLVGGVYRGPKKKSLKCRADPNNIEKKP